jgi:hypothetical protein
MARDPDTMETQQATTESAGGAGSPAGEFAAGPSRAERSMPRSGRSLPLWPIVVLIAIIALVAYLATS